MNAERAQKESELMDTAQWNAAVAAMHGLLEQLAHIGADSRGVTRLLYAEDWLRAQMFLAERMEDLGFAVRADRVGNVYGRVEGTGTSRDVILTGSHVDTVRNGGKYDGAYGIAAGIAALSCLRAAYGPPLTTLEIVSFCEEEGSRFPLSYWGSGNASGVFDWLDAEQYFDRDGVSLKDAMEAAGFGRKEQPACARDDLAAFVELHIEQGVLLERTKCRIGVVDAIVGQKRFYVTVYGEANHAGTTPMSMRRDPLACAAEMMTALEAAARIVGDPMVATVGRVEASPNTPNVIPGAVTFSMDIRHTDEKKLSAFCNRLMLDFKDIARRRGVSFDYTQWLNAKPAPMDPGLCESIERICAAEEMAFRRMPSGAGHDAQLFHAKCPTAMIFVPSRDGISHSPDEYTPPEALEDGLCVLTKLLYELAYKE